jgi:predicted TIM-barrel fold metal-dependent hydrolase
VLYPTLLLGIQGHDDVDFAEVQCRAYNDWLSDHARESGGRLFGVGLVPQQDPQRAATEIRRVASLPSMVGVFIRPNPTVDWRPLNDPVYDPIWNAASDTGLPVALHPFLHADLPGACLGMRLNRLGTSSAPVASEGATGRAGIDNVFFTQAIANPFDMMCSLAFLCAGGVCERFPSLRLVFLESGGGWLVPWLERLDHQAAIFPWDVPWLRMRPSDYFRRQCWISFDPDESTLAFTARSPLCGADRIVWASDYPHPDAVFPGVTAELDAAIESLEATPPISTDCPDKTPCSLVIWRRSRCSSTCTRRSMSSPASSLITSTLSRPCCCRSATSAKTSSAASSRQPGAAGAGRR